MVATTTTRRGSSSRLILVRIGKNDPERRGNGNRVLVYDPLERFLLVLDSDEDGRRRDGRGEQGLVARDDEIDHVGPSKEGHLVVRFLGRGVAFVRVVPDIPEDGEVLGKDR